jgi:hypothetical protein
MDVIIKYAMDAIIKRKNYFFFVPDRGSLQRLAAKQREIIHQLEVVKDSS